MSLYTINKEIEEKLDQYISSYDEESGEILDEEKFSSLHKELSELENQKDEAFHNTLYYKQNIESQIEMFDNEMERLKKKKESLVKKSERMERYIEHFYRKFYSDTKKTLFGTFTLGFRKSKSVKILDEEKIPSKFFVDIPASRRVDKVAIKDILKKGEKIEGAEMEEKENFFIKQIWKITYF